MYMPYFEQHITHLRKLTKLDMDTNITELITPEVVSERKEMIEAICSDPVITRYVPSLRTYILTIFSKKGF